MRGIIMLLFVFFIYGMSCAQNVEIKDTDDNILMRVEDEGSSGSIYLNSGTTPLSTLNKLYNVGGVLRWNGSSVGSTPWTLNGSDIYYNSGKVGIGVTSPLANLHVSGVDGAVFTGTYESGAIPLEGIGTRMMWYPNKAAFRAGYVADDSWNDANIGVGSMAFGITTKASGLFSFAGGNNSQATNDGAFAFGSSADASGQGSLAFGASAHATGYYSRAFGSNVTASGIRSVVFGYGLAVSGTYSFGIALADMTGVTVSQANTMAIMGGKVGIGSNFPSADLQVQGNDGVLFTGTVGVGSIPAQGTGTRMMWYPKKAAFRAGAAVLDEWDDAQTGNYSFAFGTNVKASAQSSIAMGEQTSAENQGSVAIGTYCHAYGSYSVAMGYNNQTNANFALALNNSTVANGNYSVAMGYNTTSSAYASFAMGEYTTASGYTSVAFGNHTIASGDYSYAMGDYIEASGEHSIAFALDNQGSVNLTQDNTMAIMGGNVGIGTLSPSRKFEVFDYIQSYVAMVKNSYPSGGDGLRVVLQASSPGNGDRFVEFLRNGGSDYSGYICGDNATGVFYTTLSDRRLKMNIEDYYGGIEMLKNIKVRKYEMRAAPGKKQIGFIAQELLEVYPQAVSGNPEGNVEEDPMGIDYGRVTPLLVSAIQEQQKMIEELKSEIELLKANQMQADNKKY